MDLGVGIKIQEYTLQEFLSAGATAEVWRVTDASGAEKAMKIFSPVIGLDPKTMDALFDEFKLTLSLEHRHILKPEKIGAYGKVPFIIMPLCKGSLQNEMNNRVLSGRETKGEHAHLFKDHEIRSFLEQVGEGVAYLHENKIIHRDLKPDNILIYNEEGNDRYVLTDFGISTQLREDLLKKTMSLKLKQSHLTPAYAAPEQFEGKVDFRSDIFSLGLIMYEMASGKLPFGSARAAGEALRNGEMLPELTADLTDELITVIYKCLSVDIDSRPSSNKLADILDQRRTQPLNKPKSSVGYVGAKTVSSKGRHFINEYPDLAQNTTKSKSGSGKWILVLSVVLVLIAGLATGLFLYSKQVDSNRITIAQSLIQNGIPKKAETILSKIWQWNKSQDADELLKVARKMKDYEDMRPFGQNKLAAVKRQGLWGFVDKYGNEIVLCSYDEVTDFFSDTAAVLKAGRCGFIDQHGNEIEKLDHEFCYRVNGKWSWNN